MTDVAINAVTRRAQFTGNTGTGPFAFTFNILADADIVVYKNTTLLSLTSDYTISTNANGTGSVTLTGSNNGTALVAADVLTIIGGRDLARTTDFVTAGALLASSLNEQLDGLVVMVQQLDEKITRSVKASPGDVFTDLELPLKDTRKGKALGFHATSGDPEAVTFYNSPGDVRAAVEAASDSNVFTDSDHSKLNAIEDSATADQTASEILTKVKTVDGTGSGLDADLLDGQEGSYYTNYADTAVSNLVDSAPASLDTLNELAAALGDDANFSTTVTNSIATKLPLAGGTMTGNIVMSGTETVDGRDLSVDGAKLDGIEDNATADQTAAEIRTLVESASDSNVFTDADHTKLNAIEANATADQTASEIRALVESASDSNVFTDADHTKLNGVEANATADQTASEILTAVKTVDGVGSDLNADLLDNQHGSYYETNTANVTAAGALMDSEVANLAQVKAFDSSDYATAAQGSTADAAMPKAGGTFTGNTSYGDNDKIIMGDGTDLQIYHDGSNSYVDDAGTGTLNLRGSDFVIISRPDGSATSATFDTNGPVGLRYNNSTKLETTATGINVTDDIKVAGDISFEGATANDYETTVTVTDPTADRTITLPDASGTVLLSDGDGSNLTNVQAASVDIDESTDDDVNYNILFSDTSGSGSIQMTPQQDDDGFTFNPSSNLVATTGTFRAGPGVADSDLLFVGYGADSSTEYVAMGVQTGYASITAGGVGSTSTDLRIRTASSGTEADKVTIKADGKTGIGTTSPSEALDVVGNIAVSGTVDGVDIAARDAVLTSTTTTANAAMPLSGGTFTGDISFEGATANDYETTLTVTDPTADRTITLPDQTGTAMLWQSAWPDDTGTARNYAIGYEALNNLASGGEDNVAYGYQALLANTTGDDNVAIGSYALAYATTVSNNTAVGYATGFGDTTQYGTFVGAYAGNYNVTSKDYQTAIGYNAMNDCSGDEVVAVGALSMSDGFHYQSVAVGMDALGRSSTASPYYNVAVGAYAGNDLYSGDFNTIVGYNADSINNNSSYSVAIGSNSDISGNFSVSVGQNAAGSSFLSADYCVFVGQSAGYDMDGGDHCTFIGNNAGYSGGAASNNTTVGTNSLRSLTSGANNSSLGSYSLYSVTSGNDNTALGSYSGYSLSTGGSNTFLGYAAGQNQDNSTTNALTTGSNVTCVGFQAIPSSGTATNEITLGDNDITSLRCNVQTISSLSDERDKTAIADLTYGLDFINDMRPVEFTWNRRDGSLGAKTDMGFIAQDLYETELNHSSTSRTRLVNWDNPEKLEADYVRSYPILVKAVQELSAQVTALQARIETLEGN